LRKSAGFPAIEKEGTEEAAHGFASQKSTREKAGDCSRRDQQKND
jgi:hypothetical protein